MLAVLYCRTQWMEQVKVADKEEALTVSSVLLEGLTDTERKDWSLVIVTGRDKAERLFGPKI